MGKPSARNGAESISEYIGNGRQTRGTETSQYPEEEKEKSIPRVAASETGKAQTKRQATEGNSPVVEMSSPPEWILSTAGHVKSRRKLGGPSPKAKYSLVTDSEPVP